MLGVSGLPYRSPLLAFKVWILTSVPGPQHLPGPAGFWGGGGKRRCASWDVAKDHGSCFAGHPSPSQQLHVPFALSSLSICRDKCPCMCSILFNLRNSLRDGSFVY